MPRLLRNPPAWSGLGLIVVLLSGCASESPTARGYFNEPIKPLSEPDGGSRAYLASLHVPWCVDLGDRHMTLEQLQSFRESFYEISRARTGGGKAEAGSIAPAGASGKTSGDFGEPSCWTLARQTGAPIQAGAHNRDVVALALPGGGSRSAVFSAAVMFELQRRNLLREVDLISSVSGGSMPAALFATSCEDEAECRGLYGAGDRVLWSAAQEERVFDMLTTDFLQGTLIKMSLPWNQFRYRTTSHDRTDTMAEVFASTLFGGREEEGEYGLRFRHMNPRRPNVVMNAMNSTGRSLGGGLEGQQFLFTLETFEDVLHSDLHGYPLSLAVVGSGAFPGAFHPLTLAAFPGTEQGAGDDGKSRKYLHIVDGGLYDRLGGEAIRVMLEDVANRERPCTRVVDEVSIEDDEDCLDRVVLIVLDSGLPFEGEDASLPDVRIPVFDLFVNHNIKMASLALLEVQSELRLNSLKGFVRDRNSQFRRKYGTFQDVFSVVDVRLREIERCVNDPLPCARAEGLTHVSLEDATRTYEELWRVVVNAPLSLEISKESAAALRRAARILVQKKIGDPCRADSELHRCLPMLQPDPRDSLRVYTGTPPQ